MLFKKKKCYLNIKKYGDTKSWFFSLNIHHHSKLCVFLFLSYINEKHSSKNRTEPAGWTRNRPGVRPGHNSKNCFKKNWNRIVWIIRKPLNQTNRTGSSGWAVLFFWKKIPKWRHLVNWQKKKRKRSELMNMKRLHFAKGRG